jgi:hypothetical protein
MSTDVEQTCKPSVRSMQRLDTSKIVTRGCQHVTIGQDQKLTARCHMNQTTDVLVKALATNYTKQMSALALPGSGGLNTQESSNIETNVRNYLSSKCPASMNNDQDIKGLDLVIDCTGTNPNPFKNIGGDGSGGGGGGGGGSTFSLLQKANAQSVCELSQAQKIASEVQSKSKSDNSRGIEGVAADAATDIAGLAMANLPMLIVGGVVFAIIGLIFALTMKKKKKHGADYSD